jgi:hypothetical protein
MHFPDDIRQDIKTFWGIPIGKMLKVLVPLGLLLAGYILWFPVPDILWRMGIAVGVFITVAGSMALNLPRLIGIYKRYRKRQKRLLDQPGAAGSEQAVSCLQDLIRLNRLHYIGDVVLMEWDHGWVSTLCYLHTQPIDYESPTTVSNCQKGLKDALAVASGNNVRLCWIDDADFEYNKTFWDERREQALKNCCPAGRDLTLDRMTTYETLAQTWAISNRLMLRIDASLSQLMREEYGDTDLQRKERALVAFSNTVSSFADVMQRAAVTVTPMEEDDLLWVIEREVAPWTRGRLSPWLKEDEVVHERPENFEEQEQSLGALAFQEMDECTEKAQTISVQDTNENQESKLTSHPITKAPTLSAVHKEPVQHQRTPSPKINKPSSTPIPNPFMKPSKTLWNPYARQVQKPKEPVHVKQNVIPLVRPLTFPDHVVVVLGTKRYAGVTTVAVNLTPVKGLLINLERGSQPQVWPKSFEVRSVSGEQRVSEIIRLANDYALVIVDLGLYTEDCLDLVKAAQKMVYVSDNQPGSLGASLQQTETLPVEKIVLAINKAMPSGLSPGLLSAQLGMPIGIMIPFDHTYSCEDYGLSLPRKPWEIVRQLIMDREAMTL